MAYDVYLAHASDNLPFATELHDALKNPAHLRAMTAEAHCEATRTLRTHCARGHAFDNANTYVNPKGRRQCRRCAANATVRRRCRKRGGQGSTD